jgi:hypothetical protein
MTKQTNSEGFPWTNSAAHIYRNSNPASPDPGPQPGYHEFMVAMIDRAKRTPIKEVDQEDPEIISKVRHTMLPKEKLMEWFSRVGLGKAQIMAGMSKRDISRFVEQAERNRAEEDTVSPMFQRTVPKFLMV